MTPSPDPRGEGFVSQPPMILPLIRYMSRIASNALLKQPITPNQCTTLSMLLGFAAAAALILHSWLWDVAAGALLVASYVLDNCDGEIARAKGLCTVFGKHYDTFVDWLVHAVFFLGLGVGEALARNESMWLWLGVATAAGGTVNYFLGFLSMGDDSEVTEAEVALGAEVPHGFWEWVLYAFRELTRADFCFIVLALALFDDLWLLLPAAAVGSQVYWVTALHRRARAFHV